MTATEYAVIIVTLFGFAIGEYALGRIQKAKVSASDNVLDIFGFALLAAFTQPFILFLANAIGMKFAPTYHNALIDIPWYVALGLLLIFDDMLQYWWHRLSHTSKLWPLHRAHHSSHYMSVRIVYRNNFFYYLAMPAIWGTGFLVFLGLSKVFLIYIVVKLTVIAGAHSSVRWDEPLYKIKALRPVMWLVQRIISTPATHFAHHAMSNDDGIGHYKGNFGNLLFFWDVLFGTAHITQQYPPQIGLRDDQLFGSEKWYTELFYPIFKSKRTHTALTPGGVPYDDSVT